MHYWMTSDEFRVTFHVPSSPPFSLLLAWSSFTSPPATYPNTTPVYMYNILSEEAERIFPKTNETSREIHLSSIAQMHHKDLVILTMRSSWLEYHPLMIIHLPLLTFFFLPFCIRTSRRRKNIQRQEIFPHDVSLEYVEHVRRDFLMIKSTTIIIHFSSS